MRGHLKPLRLRLALPNPNQRKPMQFQRAQTAKAEQLEQMEQKAQTGQVNSTALSRANQIRWYQIHWQISRRSNKASIHLTKDNKVPFPARKTRVLCRRPRWSSFKA